MARGRSKGKRNYGAIDKDAKKMIEDLSTTEKRYSHTLFMEVDVYANRISDDVATELIKTLLKRVSSSKMSDILAIFAGRQSLKTTEKLVEVFGDHVDMDFWIDLIRKKKETHEKARLK